MGPCAYLEVGTALVGMWCRAVFIPPTSHPLVSLRVMGGGRGEACEVGSVYWIGWDGVGFIPLSSNPLVRSGGTGESRVHWFQLRRDPDKLSFFGPETTAFIGAQVRG